jgi:hypothetical protein
MNKKEYTMPNNIMNDVTFNSNDKGTIDELRKFVKSAVQDFDFDKIRPLPDALKGIHSGSISIDDKRYNYWRHVDDKSVGLENDEVGRLYDKYGAAFSNDWCVKNWGTKWNAYNLIGDPKVFRHSGDDYSIQYYFYTAWSAPAPILAALLDKFPALEVNWVCQDEFEESSWYLQECL